jgi:hypothetical protein
MKSHRFLAPLAAIALALTAAGCGSDAPKTPEPPAATSASQAPEYAGDWEYTQDGDTMSISLKADGTCSIVLTGQGSIADCKYDNTKITATQDDQKLELTMNYDADNDTLTLTAEGDTITFYRPGEQPEPSDDETEAVDAVAGDWYCTSYPGYDEVNFMLYSDGSFSLWLNGEKSQEGTWDAATQTIQNADGQSIGYIYDASSDTLGIDLDADGNYYEFSHH